MKSGVERALSPLLGLLLFLQAGILVTGGIVRLSNSGLGCPTWPRCTDDSLTPVANQPEGQLHSWIEFGNRLIAVALIVIALASLILILVLKRKDIRALAIGQLAGVLAQIPLGGITVLTHLNPFSVASHFILSIILIAAATSLFDRRKLNGARILIENSRIKSLIRWLVTLTVAVIILGTGVTGAGPHAGDYSAPRFNINIHLITWIHAILVIALLLVTLYLFALSRIDSRLGKRITAFIGIILLQGIIGIVQYAQGLPELLVGSHLVGVTLVWIGAWRINLLTIHSPKSND